jgi:hypothetical protein
MPIFGQAVMAVYGAAAHSYTEFVTPIGANRTTHLDPAGKQISCTKMSLPLLAALFARNKLVQ